MTERKAICCPEFLATMIKTHAGLHVPVSEIKENIDAAVSAGLPTDTGLLIAVAVGHRVLKHGDGLDAALEFARGAGVPDVRAKMASAADIVDSCDANIELALKMIETGVLLSDEVAGEIKEMARVAKIPENFSQPQVIVCLHNIKVHGDSLDETIRFMAGDNPFTRLQARHRPN